MMKSVKPKPEIYIQIPAYRDKELVATLRDLLATAAQPESLRIGVCWQFAANEILPEDILHHPQIEIIFVSYQESKGCNWARSLLQQKWNGEPYTLLLDSHHRFIQDWDMHLVNMYQGLKKQGVNKPLITAYLPPYDPNNEPQGRGEDVLQIKAHSREQGMLIYLVAYPVPLWSWLEEPIRAKYVSLHFLFTEGLFNHEILFDDSVYFFGDEVVTALRSYTHGYELFHPHYIIGWHLYRRNETRVTHWEDHDDFKERHTQSHEKIRNIFLGIEDHILGVERSIKDYEFLIADKLISG